MKSISFSKDTVNYRSAYAKVILLAFLMTNLFPLSLRADIQRSQTVEYPPFQINFVDEKSEVYDVLNEELEVYPALGELLDESFIDSIIDKIIMANRQMSLAPILWSPVTALEQLEANQQINEMQVQALIYRLVQEQWPEQLLGSSLYQSLVEQLMERYSAEQLENFQQVICQAIIYLLRSDDSEVNQRPLLVHLLSESKFSSGMATPMGFHMNTSFSKLTRSLISIIKNPRNESVSIYANTDSQQHDSSGSNGSSSSSSGNSPGGNKNIGWIIAASVVGGMIIAVAAIIIIYKILVIRATKPGAGF